MGIPECDSMRREKVCPLEVEEGTHIKFVEAEFQPKVKTKTWVVISKYGDGDLGTIMWFGRWRKYAFFPLPDTVYEQVCMREIALFIENKTRKHNVIVKQRKLMNLAQGRDVKMTIHECGVCAERKEMPVMIQAGSGGKTSEYECPNCGSQLTGYVFRAYPQGCLRTGIGKRIKRLS
jgi:DNA-directed RNA polymerase subunit M/transcription elongation factor TFIIS